MFWNDLLTLGLNFGGVKEDSFCSLLDTALPRAPGVNKGDTYSTQDYLFYELHYSLVMSNLTLFPYKLHTVRTSIQQ